MAATSPKQPASLASNSTNTAPDHCSLPHDIMQPPLSNGRLCLAHRRLSGQLSLYCTYHTHSAESIYPPKLREDDVFGLFVREHNITSKNYRQYEKTPEQFEKCISSRKAAVVLFFQPCKIVHEHTLPFACLSHELFNSSVCVCVCMHGL